MTDTDKATLRAAIEPMRRHIQFDPTGRALMDQVRGYNEALDDVLRAFEALPSGETWQPIETAPKDVEILGWFPYYAADPPGGSVFVMRWDADAYAKPPRPYFEASGWVWGKRDQRAKQPTHWRPLPLAPTPEEPRRG